MAAGSAGERSSLDYALRVLSRRQVSSGNMKQLLSRKGYNETDAESCVAKLKEWGYLDDQGYAKDVLHAMMGECPVGRRRAVFELRKRFLDRELTKEVVDEIYSGLSEEALAKEAARRYLKGRNAGSLKGKERERLAGWLLRRGFGYAAVRSALGDAGQGDPE